MPRTLTVQLKDPEGEDQITIIVEGACAGPQVTSPRMKAAMEAVLTTLDLERVPDDKIIVQVEEEV